MDESEVLDLMVAEGVVIEQEGKYSLSAEGKKMFWAAHNEFNQVRQYFNEAVAGGMRTGLAQIVIVGEIYRMSLSKGRANDGA